MVELKQVIADEDPLAVEGDAVTFRGARPGGNDKMRGRI